MDKNELFDILNALIFGGYSDETVTYKFEDTTLKAEFGENAIGDCKLDGRYIAVYLKDADEYNDFWRYLVDNVGWEEYEIISFFGSDKLVVLFTV